MVVQIIESYLSSKKGEEFGGEDRLITGPNFFGVVDGATDKSGNNWGTKSFPKTGGAVLADIIKETLENPQTTTRRGTLIEIINEKIHSSAKRACVDLDLIPNRPAANFATYDARSNRIVYMGDCNFGFLKKDGNFETHYNGKKVDDLTSKIRAKTIQKYIKQGIDPFENGKDLGREAILEALKRQYELQNLNENSIESEEEWMFGIPKRELAYRVIDGFPTRLSAFRVPKDTTKIVIASDGFKTLKPTLNETMETLQKQLKEDPHCIGELMSTKGLQPGNISFDDMSYISFTPEK